MIAPVGVELLEFVELTFEGGGGAPLLADHCRVIAESFMVAADVNGRRVYERSLFSLPVVPTWGGGMRVKAEIGYRIRAGDDVTVSLVPTVVSVSFAFRVDAALSLTGSMTVDPTVN